MSTLLLDDTDRAVTTPADDTSAILRRTRITAATAWVAGLAALGTLAVLVLDVTR